MHGAKTAADTVARGATASAGVVMHGATVGAGVARSGVGVVRSYPIVSLTAAVVLGYACVYGNDFITLKRIARQIFAQSGCYDTRDRVTEDKFRFYGWHLPSEGRAGAPDRWLTAQDVRGNSVRVLDTLCTELCFSGAGSRIFLKDDQNQTVLPRINSDGQPHVDSLRIISEMMQRELDELSKIKGRLTVLEFKRLAGFGIHIIDRLPIVASISKKLIVDHLRKCEAGRDGVVDPSRFYDLEADIGALSGGDFNDLLTRWRDYLNGYGTFINPFRRPFSKREKEKMRLYVITAARKARLSAIKRLIDEKIATFPGIHEGDIEGGRRNLLRAECGAQVGRILAARAADRLPEMDDIQALVSSISGLRGRCQAEWPNPTDSQTIILMNFDRTIVELEAVVRLRGMVNAPSSPVQRSDYNRLIFPHIDNIENYYNSLIA